MSHNDEVLLTARSAAAARNQKGSGSTLYPHDNGVLQGWYVTTIEPLSGDTWSEQTLILLTSSGELYSLHVVEASRVDAEGHVSGRTLTRISTSLRWPESRKIEVIHSLRLVGQA